MNEENKKSRTSEEIDKFISEAREYLSPYQKIGLDIGSLVTEKNRAYGDSFNQSEKIIKILYPNGVTPDQYQDMLTVIRIIDKLFRIATDKDAFGESPWNDITGYSVLAVERKNRN